MRSWGGGWIDESDQTVRGTVGISYTELRNPHRPMVYFINKSNLYVSSLHLGVKFATYSGK